MGKFAWIKSHLGLFGAATLTCCMFAYFAANVSDHGLFFDRPTSDDINDTLKSFMISHKPEIEINFTALYGGSGQFEILHPLFDKRKLRFQDANPTCTDDPTVPVKSIVLRDEGTRLKDASLEKFLTGKGQLTSDFLTMPPFISENGKSYAYLLLKSGAHEFEDKNWIENNLSFFKVSELAEILNKYHIISPEFAAIARLDESEIGRIVRGSELILTRDFVLIKNQPRLAFSPLSYWLYDARDLQAFLKDGKYEVNTLGSQSVCIYKNGNTCWTYNSKHMSAFVYRYSLVIVLLAGLFILVSFGFYFRNIYLKTKEQRKHQLALQVLSHEFRTPVSSMLLLAEQLAKKDFKPEEQDLITRISSEAFRLQRIIEVSRTYLQTESHRIQFSYVELPSINEWISDFAAEFSFGIQCRLLDQDTKIKIDPFWLRFVLSNLIQNAFAHGKPPVTILLSNTHGKLKITVEDHGICEFSSLQEMTDAFTKSRSSKGMGLGLNISKFILDSWGAKIEFSTAPTSFSLSLES